MVVNDVKLGMFVGGENVLVCRFRFVPKLEGGWCLRLARKPNFFRSLFGGDDFLEVWDNVPESMMRDCHVARVLDVDSQIASEKLVTIFPYDIKSHKRLGLFENNDLVLELKMLRIKRRDLNTLCSQQLEELKRRPDLNASINFIKSLKKDLESLNTFHNKGGGQ